MKISGSLSTHLESYINLLPALHKTIRICKKKSDEVIYEHVLNGDFLEPSIIMPKIT